MSYPTDTDRLNFMQENCLDVICGANDDWIVLLDSHNERPSSWWRPTLREAIDAAMERQDKENERGN